MSGKRRTGLSTLELVLALPMLLFVMALMINFGRVARWKVRGWLAARHAVWQSRWPRSYGYFPRPDYWPTTANMGAGGGAAVTALDHPAVDQPVARGPSLMDTRVNEDLLDPTRGMRHGSSELRRSFPLLSRLGEYHLLTGTQLLDNAWQFQRMGLYSTRQRRIPILYQFPTTDRSYADAYVRAALAIYDAPFRPALFPLDRDDEFIYYSERFGWGTGAPDFHPDLRSCCGCCGIEPGGDCCHRGTPFCCTEHAVVQALVDDLVERIQGVVERDDDGNVIRRVPCVAENMAVAFRNLYRRVIRELNDLIAADPPPTPTEIASMRAEIAELERRIAILDAYIDLLRHAPS